MSTGTPSVQVSRVRRPTGDLWASFDSVLCLCGFFCLPLHVAWFIRTAVLQRHDVIDDVTGTRASSPAVGWAGMAPLEGSPGRRVPLDPAVRVDRHVSVNFVVVAGAGVSMLVREPPSFEAEGFDWVQIRGLAGRVVAEENADRHREERGTGDCDQGDQLRPSEYGRQQERNANPK